MHTTLLLVLVLSWIVGTEFRTFWVLRWVYSFMKISFQISSLIFISLLLCSRRWNVDREFYFWERWLSLIRHKVLEKTILEWCLGKAWSMRKGQFVFHFFWHPNTSSSNICFHYVVHVIQCTQNTLHSTSIGSSTS